MLGEAERRSESVGPLCLALQRTSSWMPLRLAHVQQINLTKKKKESTFLNKGLHLRTRWLGVFVHSCTVAEWGEKKERNHFLLID